MVGHRRAVMEDVLRTDRLRLRKMTMDDANRLLRIFSDQVALRYYPHTKDHEETQKWIEWTLSNYRNYGLGLWIVERRCDGEFLGQCGVVPQELHGALVFEVGYLFVQAFWGQGFATEAARASRDWGFRHTDSRALISLIHPQNAPSARVARRIGMTLQEQIVWHERPTDVYAISRDAWAADGHGLAPE